MQFYNQILICAELNTMHGQVILDFHTMTAHGEYLMLVTNRLAVQHHHWVGVIREGGRQENVAKEVV